METEKILGIYLGKFSPAHKGQLRVYNILKKIVGENTYIGIYGNEVKLPESPLTFQEKQQIWVKHGVSAEKIVEIKNPNNPVEITSKFEPNIPTLSVVLDKNVGDITKNFKTKTLRVPMSYSYVNRRPLTDATIFEMLGSPKYSDEQKQKFFKFIFGWYDIAMFQNLTDKFKHDDTNISERVNDVVNKILSEDDAKRQAALKKQKEYLVKQREVELSDAKKRLGDTAANKSNAVTPLDKKQVELDAKKEKMELTQATKLLQTAKMEKAAIK